MKNYGLNWELEKLQESKEDWVFGAVSPVCLAEGLSELQRDVFLPKGEVQRGAEDTMDCATRGPINILEIKFNYLVNNKVISKRGFKFLYDNGYINRSNRIEFSDAFIAIKSGTTRNGNSMKAPLEAIRLYGLIPKSMLPLEKWMTFEDYHKEERITEEMEDLGQEFRKHFNINYEKVYEKNLDELLERDIINMAGYAWDRPVNGEYLRSENRPNHVFVGIRKPRTYIFDNYIDSVDGDFIKKLAPDYDFLDYGYRIIISENKTGEVKQSWWEIIINFIKKLWQKN